MARLFALLGLVVAQVAGHGVLKIPSSRSWECKSAHNQGYNSDSCAIRSVWGIQNYGWFPELGPLYGNIASAGMAAKAVLDEQSSTRWWKSKMSPGKNQFQWEYLREGTNHLTDGFKYFITVPAWNPNSYLTVNSFEEEPMCEFDLGGTDPPLIVNHVCDVPYRTGYHVILAVWYATRNNGQIQRSFYQVADVDFSDGGGGGGGPSAVDVLPMENYNNAAESITNSPSEYYGQGLGPNFLTEAVGLPPMPDRPLVPIGQTVWLQNTRGGYVDGSDGALVSKEQASTLNDGEKFDVVDAGNGYIALRAQNGLYVAADKGLSSTLPPLVADRKKIGAWEKFEWVSLGDYSMALKASVNGKYVRAYYARNGNPMLAGTYNQVPINWGSTSW